MRISIVMPAYNEAKNIEATVARCSEILNGLPGEHEIVVTNDGSADETLIILERIAAGNRKLVVLSHHPNQGYGAALAKAIQYSTGETVVTIDSDGQFDIGELPVLLEQFGRDIDVLTGYRISKQDTLLKVFADRMMNLMIRVGFRVPFKDTNCAFKVCKGSVLRELNLEARGFQIPTEIVLKAHALDLNVREAPVHHHPRQGGSSALAPVKTAIRMLKFLVYLRFKFWLFRSQVLRGL
jgi:dolichol-phosphate mannosyltransferase